MKAEIILFDLDGTLTDSADGIIRSIQYALDSLGIPGGEDPGFLRQFVGPPFLEAVKELLGLEEDKAQEALARYRERYNREGWKENTVYPGIVSLLEGLCQAGKRLLVATSKPERISKEILRHFQLDKYFEHICGDSPGHTRPTKAHVISYALSLAGIQEAGIGKAVMVGDRRYDVEGAHTAGIPCIGVLYGYGSRDELERCQAEAIVQTPEELGRLLL